MNNATQKWYATLSDKINHLSEEFGLDEVQTDRLRSFIVTTAKEQYRSGNRSGAAWAFKQARAVAT